MATATLSSKAQVVIPAEIRRKLGLKPGDRLHMEVRDDTVVIRKAPASAVEALKELRSPVWNGYDETLLRERDEWDE